MKHIRKSFFSLLICTVMLLTAFAPLIALMPQSVNAAESGIEVLSAVKAKGAWSYTITFSEPVHIFKQGYFWLRQANAADGTAQCSCTGIEYLGDVTKQDDDSYSTILRLTFSTPSDSFNQQSYGIAMVEYFLSDTNSGYVSPQVICGKDGKMLLGNYVNGGLDFTWIPTDARDSTNTYSVHITESSEGATGIKVLSAVKEPDSWVYTITFSEPVHIFKQGYFWLRQANAADGTAQCSCTGIEYLGDATMKDTVVYSTTLRLTFSTPSAAFNQESYGISMVEYFLSDTNSGYVSPQVICGKDGKMLLGNYVNGGLDFTWIPTDARDSKNTYTVHITERQVAPNLLYVDVLSDTVAAFIFDTEVTAGSLDGLTASANGATASVKAIKEGSPKVPYTIVVEFDRAIDKTDFDMKSSFASSAKGVPASPKKAKFSEMVPTCDLTIESGERYSLMNCDTGRLLTYDGQEEFRIISNGDGTFSLQSVDRTKYLSADASGKLSFSKERTDFRLITSNDYSRVQLHLFGAGILLADNDGGTTAAAETSQQKPGSVAIETGWYLTKHGDSLPMRVAMLGDSITNGCTPEGGQPKAGCRAQLSAALVEKYGRVVFVGSAVASHGGDGSGGSKTTVNDPFLYRSEGHNGWVVTSQDGYKTANNYGIDTLVPNLMTKYQPDIVCMMIGINDLNQLGQLDAVVNNQPAGDAFFKRWSTLAKDILSRMEENDRLIVGTYTPFRANDALNTAKNAKVSIANERLRQAVTALNDTRVSIAENYNHVIATGVEGISTDGIHLTAKGYSALGDSYYEAIVKVADSTLDSIGDDTQTDDSAATDAPSSDDEPNNPSTGNRSGLYGILVIGSLLLLGVVILVIRNRCVSQKQ